MKQLNDGEVPGKPVVIPIDNRSLTEDDKEKDLYAVNIIEEKRDGRVKGRTCANGRKLVMVGLLKRGHTYNPYTQY